VPPPKPSNKRFRIVVVFGFNRTNVALDVLLIDCCHGFSYFINSDAKLQNIFNLLLNIVPPKQKIAKVNVVFSWPPKSKLKP